MFRVRNELQETKLLTRHVCLASPGITRILWNPKFHYRAHKSPISVYRSEFQMAEFPPKTKPVTHRDYRTRRHHLSSRVTAAAVHSSRLQNTQQMTSFTFRYVNSFSIIAFTCSSCSPFCGHKFTTDLCSLLFERGRRDAWGGSDRRGAGYLVL